MGINYRNEPPYRWYLNQPFGLANLWDMADIRNHRHHRAFRMLITEFRGSSYLDPCTREIVKTGDQNIISNPFGEYMEFAVVMHDGIRLVDKDGNLIIDPEPLLLDIEDIELEDFEDQGSRAYNYRAERFKHLLAQNLDILKVFTLPCSPGSKQHRYF